MTSQFHRDRALYFFPVSAARSSSRQPGPPIITGKVYNRVNAFPYTLPDEKAKTTFKSSSIPGGQGFTELRFEDKAGEEQIFIHSQRQLDSRGQSSLKPSVLTIMFGPEETLFWRQVATSITADRSSQRGSRGFRSQRYQVAECHLGAVPGNIPNKFSIYLSLSIDYHGFDNLQTKQMFRDPGDCFSVNAIKTPKGSACQGSF